METILAPLFVKSNSGACCTAIGSADNCGMTDSKKSKIEPVHEEESEKLRAIFKERGDGIAVRGKVANFLFGDVILSPCVIE